MSPEKIVLDEFGAYYLGDELVVGPDFVGQQVPARAKASAARMIAALRGEDRAPVIALLRRLADNRNDPLHTKIGEHTMLWWADDDELFAVFGSLVDAMITELQR